METTMNLSHQKLAGFALGFFLAGSIALAEKPITLDNVKSPGPNKPNEALAKDFSMDRALRFLDSASLYWQVKRGCFTCHTNYAYLMARPMTLPAPTTDTNPVIAHKQVRAFAEKLVAKRWPDKGPRWDAEVVATATALAFNDAQTSKKLHPLTRKALDRMWTIQRKDGGFDWIKCGWPPMESDDDYGVVLAAIGVGVAPEKYIATPKAKAGLDKIREFLKNNPPPTLHHQAMLLWASSYIDDLMPEADKQASIKTLLALQKKDGGWGLATLGHWKRADGTEQDKTSSDGYGTGFVSFVLLRAGIRHDHPQLLRAVHWLKTNQRESGRWFTRSLNKDNRHYITHAGTAFAVMALSEQKRSASKKAEGKKAQGK